jgi:transcription initiation factor TFIID subunit 7
LQKRFEDALKKLTVDLEMKLSQRDEMKEKQRLKKEGIVLDVDHDTDPDGVGNDDGGDVEVEGGLFGSDDPVAVMPMDIV